MAPAELGRLLLGAILGSMPGLAQTAAARCLVQPQPMGAAAAAAAAERALLALLLVPWVAAAAAVRDRVASQGQVDKAMPVAVAQNAMTVASAMVRLPPVVAVVRVLLVQSAPGAVQPHMAATVARATIGLSPARHTLAAAAVASRPAAHKSWWRVLAALVAEVQAPEMRLVHPAQVPQGVLRPTTVAVVVVPQRKRTDSWAEPVTRASSSWPTSSPVRLARTARTRVPAACRAT